MGLFGLTRKSKQPVIINEYYTYNTPTYNTSAVRPPQNKIPHPQPTKFCRRPPQPSSRPRFSLATKLRHGCRRVGLATRPSARN